jgi:hypothetical protein
MKEDELVCHYLIEARRKLAFFMEEINFRRRKYSLPGTYLYG